MDRALAQRISREVFDEMRRAILPGSDWRIYRRSVRLLQEIKPDIVHTHTSKAGIIGGLGCQSVRGMPAVVHTIHGLAFTASTNPTVNDVYKMLEKRAAPLTTRIVCVADAMRDQSLAGHIGRPEQYVTVYSGMETAPFLNPPMPLEAGAGRS